MKYSSEEIDNARATAIQSLIKWGKKGLAYFPMRNAVNRYMEVAGMNVMSIEGEDGIRAHRKNPPILLVLFHLFVEIEPN